MSRNRAYVGYGPVGYYTKYWHVFMCNTVPTEDTHPQYLYVIGPWHTKMDAVHWVSNPSMPINNSLAYRAPR